MSNTINKVFGDRLRTLRNEAGLRLEDVGDWFKMGKSTVSQWESGRLPHATILDGLATRFGVSIDYLLGRTNNRNFSDDINLTRLFQIADKMDLDAERRKALEKLKNAPISEQQARLDNAIIEYLSLPEETREALRILIKNLSASQK